MIVGSVPGFLVQFLDNVKGGIKLYQRGGVNPAIGILCFTNVSSASGPVVSGDVRPVKYVNTFTA